MESANGSQQRQLYVLLLGALVTMLNVAITNVALPSIAADLQAAATQIHLIADGFAIALTSFVLIAGAIGDRYGRKRLFLFGSGMIVPTSIMAAMADTAESLIFWRMLAGLATAALFPTTLSMITSMYTDPAARIKAVALWSGTAAFGAAMAPPAAGLLLQYFHWGSVFLLSTPLAAAAFIVGLKVLVEPPSHHTGPVDWIGGGLTVVMVGTLLYGVIELPVEGWDREVITLFSVSAVALVAFLIRERRTPHPLLDLQVFRIRRFSVASVILLVLSLGLAGVMYLAAQYTQSVLGYSTMKAGVSTLPLPLAVLIFSPISARLDGRFGSKRVVSAGMVIVSAGFLTGVLWSETSPYGLLALTYVLIGVGMGLAMAPTTNAIMGSLPEAKAGVGSAVNDLMRDLGSSLGIAVCGSIAAVTYSTLMTQVYNDLPADQQARIPEEVYTVIRSSLNGALAVAEQYPGPNADKLLVVAREAFISGQDEVMLLGAALSFASALLAWFLLPSANPE